MDFDIKPIKEELDNALKLEINQEMIVKEEAAEGENFPCKFCEEKCKNKAALKYHKAARHGGKIYKCNRCPFSTRIKGKFDDHVSTHGEKHESHKCTICDKTFRHKRSIQSHIKARHSDEKYNCDRCDYTSTAIRSFKAHHLRHEKIKPDPHKLHRCSRCEYAANHEKYLHIHLRNKHNDLDQSIDGFYTCKMCPEKYDQLDLLNKHMIKHKIHTCETCLNYAPNSTKLKIHRKLHEKSIDLFCKSCDFETKTHRDLILHRCPTKEANRVYCHLCDYSTLRNSFLIVHVLRMHNVNTFACAECSETFPIENSLAEHIKKFHTQTNYQCEYCLRYLMDGFRLKKHQAVCAVVNIETKQQRRLCHLCDYSNIRDDNLIAHIVKHHGGVKDFVCRQCDEAFHSEFTRNKHTKSYHIVTKFRCEFCQKYSQNTRDLTAHAATCQRQHAFDVKFVSCN